MVPELAARYRAEGQEFTPIEVPVWTLAQVVAEHVPGPVDFLKVDVEGFEREVLAGADWSSFRPRVVVMEATVPKSDEPAHEAWEPMLFEVGYRFAMFDGLNRFYAHADEPALLQALTTPANVFDDFVPYAWAHQVDQAQQWAHSLQDTLSPDTTGTQPAVREGGHAHAQPPATRRIRLRSPTSASRYSVMTSTLRSCERRERFRD